MRAIRFSNATFFLMGIVLILSLFPSLSSLFSYERVALESGKLWLAFTGHFTHWSFEHLFWDLGTFALLAAVLEYTQGKDSINGVFTVPGVALISALGISLGMYFLYPEVSSYRGLSGVCSALFMMLAMRVYMFAKDTSDLLLTALSQVGIVLFVGKMLFEMFFGVTLFDSSSQSLYSVIPFSHLGGAIIGALLEFLRISLRADKVSSTSLSGDMACS